MSAADVPTIAQKSPEELAAEAAAKTRPDPLLRETAAILADAINLLTGNSKLANQVMPVTHQATVWSD